MGIKLKSRETDINK